MRSALTIALVGLSLSFASVVNAQAPATAGSSERILKTG